MAAVLNPPPRRGPYPFWLESPPGGIAASIAAGTTHPLDLTKVRLQASSDKRMLASLKRTIATRGIPGLWDGLTGTLMRQMSYSLCRFWAYDQAKLLIHPADNKNPIAVSEMVTAGAMAGAIAGVVGNPGEIVMVRMQADYGKPPAQQLHYRNCFDALYRMTKEEGFASWKRGLSANVLRSILMNASQLGSYDIFKGLGMKNGMKDDVKLHVAASFAAGTLATTVCSPADVVKSRIMSSSGSSSVFQVIRSSLKNEGALFMFKGWVPSWIRLQPTTTLIFLTYEALKKGVDQYYGRPTE